jgi:hypothetical protein
MLVLVIIQFQTVFILKSTIFCLPPAFLLGSFFDPEDGGDMFL